MVQPEVTLESVVLSLKYSKCIFLYSNPNFTHSYPYRFPLNLDRSMLPSKDIASHTPLLLRGTKSLELL